MRFYSFDLFEGLPDFAGHLIEQWRPGQLATSENDFDRLIAEHNLLPSKIFKHNGYYKDSLTPSLSKTLLESEIKAAFIHIDCDFYDSAVSVFNFIEPFLQHGTVLYLNDVFCAFKETSKGGVLGAFNEFQKK